jgi:hypothetical protein
MSQPQGRRQAADACADHHDLLLLIHSSSPEGLRDC